MRKIQEVLRLKWERGLSNREVAVIRLVQPALEAIQPVQRGFQDEAGVEAGGAWVAVDMALRLARISSNVAETVGEEGEVDHDSRVR